MIDRRMELPSTDVSGLVSGANRILVGGEIIQYATAKPLGEGRWELKGLLRGRGGTEIAAAAGHASSAAVTVIDERLTKLEQSLVPVVSTETYAAIGRADEQPVFAAVETARSSLKPPSPVHARKAVSVEGNWRLEWTRRARGAWRWTDAADVPLIEETESYLVGIGAVGSPVALLTTKASSLELSAETVAQYQSESPGASIWVRQIGSHGQSDPLLLAHLPH